MFRKLKSVVVFLKIFTTLVLSRSLDTSTKVIHWKHKADLGGSFIIRLLIN